MENVKPSDKAAAAKTRTAARSDETDRTASDDDDQVYSWRARRRDVPPNWSSGHSPAEWAEAKRWAHSGATVPAKFCPIGLVPGGLFETAEDVQALLGLDTVPDTIETVTMAVPGKEPVPLKYCWVPLAHKISLCEAAVLADAELVVGENGDRRFVDMPLRLRDKRKLRKGKLPPFLH